MLMRRLLPVLITASMLAAGLLTAAVTATPALAGTGPVCDNNITTGLCLYANGTNGHDVYGRALDGGGNAFETDPELANVCDNTSKVSASEECPFSDDALNSKYNGDSIFTMTNSPWYFLGRASGAVVQGNKGTGYLWIRVPTGQPDIYYFVNVAESNNFSTPEFLCAGAANDPVYLSPVFAGSGDCEWVSTGGF